MAESSGNNSVGKISLDLEVTGDLSKQIGESAKKIGNQLEKNISSSMKNMFDVLNSSIENSMKSINDSVKVAMDKMTDTAKKSMNDIEKASKSIKIATPKVVKSNDETTTIKKEPITEPIEPIKPNIKMPDVTSSLKTSLNVITQKIRSIITSGLATLKNIKMPKIEFPKAENDKPNISNNKGKTTTRGPPIDTTAIKAEIDSTAKALDIVNAKIEQQQVKLAELKQSYNMAFNEAKKNALQEQILKTESAINSLIAKSDKLGFKLSDLDVKLASTGNETGRTANKFNLLSKITKGFGSLANGTANMTKKLSSAFKGLGNSCKESNKRINNMHSGIGNIAKQFATWMIILPIIMNSLNAMESGLMANLKTNEQFSNSLAQIKTNLMVAFTPIYQAILPAINALMSALATATTYIASFISAIFGKTYQQSYQATQQLIDAKEAMGAYGDSAKKAAKDALGLAGFDEINKLNKSDSSSDNSKVPTLTQPSLNTDEVDSKMKTLADKFKDILSKIFDPMKEAWDKEGKNTLDSMNYALSSIWQLAKDIGNTFLNVWDNGTGIKVCTDILKLLQAIFNIIGDIAKAFKTAWDNGNLGEKVIQAIFNALDSVLKLLIDIGNTFRDVWNSGLGVEICTNILEILKNIFTIIGQISDSFRNAWNSGLGEKIITDILNLLNGCLGVIQDITSSFSKAWETNGDTICSGILQILDDIFGILGDIANAWANAWEDNGNGDTLMNSLLELLGKIFTTIGDIGEGMRASIGNVAEEVFGALIQFCTDVSDSLGNVTDGFKIIWDNGGQHLFDGIVQLISKVGELILKITGGAFKDASGIFKDILAPAIGEVFDIVGYLVDKLAEFTDWINNNKPLIDILSAAFVGIGSALAGAKIASLLLGAVEALSTFTSAMSFVFSGGFISGIVDLGGALVAAIGGWPVLIGAAIIAIGVVIYQHWDEIKEKTFEIWNSIGDWIETKWDNFKTWASEKFGAIKESISQSWEETKTATSEKWETIKTTLSEKWEGIKTKCSEAWGDMKENISTKWGEVKENTSSTWENIKTSLGSTWDKLKTDSSTKWGEIKDGISKSWDDLKTKNSETWENIKTEFDNIVTFVKTTFSTGWSNAWNGVKQIFKGVFDSLVGIAKAPINGVLRLINGMIEGINLAIKALNKIDIDIPDWIPGIGGESFGFNIPTIGKVPYLAKGGIIDSPTLAMVGEAGKEAVVPLENNTGWISDLATKIAALIGTNNNVVNTEQQGGDIIFMIDGSVIGKVALNQLRKMQKQGVIKVIPT